MQQDAMREGSSQTVSEKASDAPFRYFDQGHMAVVGKGFAVLQSGRLHLSGFGAWLRGPRCTSSSSASRASGQRVRPVGVTYLTGQRGSRLIVNHRASEPRSAAATRAPEVSGFERVSENVAFWLAEGTTWVVCPSVPAAP